METKQRAWLFACCSLRVSSSKSSEHDGSVMGRHMHSQNHSSLLLVSRFVQRALIAILTCSLLMSLVPSEVFAQEIQDQDQPPAVTTTSDETALDEAIQALEDANWRPNPTYGVDSNINEMVIQELTELGVDASGIEVRTHAVEFSATNDAATVGIDTSDSNNGAITYFFVNPSDLAYAWSYSTLQQATITFTLSKGDASRTWTPARTTTIPWDKSRVAALLEEQAQKITLTFSEGESAEAVTSSFSLPTKVPGASWASVSWSSNSDALKITGYSWDDELTAIPTRQATDQTVTLTATISLTGTENDTYTQSYEIVIKADPEAVAEEQQELAEKLDEGFSEEALRTLGTEETVNTDALDCDLQLPTTRTLGIDGKSYNVNYTTSDEALRVNGYAAYVYRPLPGESARKVSLTLTVTSKDNPAITAAKSIDLTIEPLNDDEIQAELDLMAEAKQGYADALADGANLSALDTSLHPFQKAYRDENGKLAWAYSEADAYPGGIVTVDLPGAGETSGYRLFRSSRPDLIAHENLVLGERPLYNTEVTITSCLSSKNYARYAEEYPDDMRFQALANQEASASVVVRGSSGLDDPNAQKPLLVTVSIVGPDASGTQTYWAQALPVSCDAGATAADATLQALTSAGLTYDYSAGYLSSITSPYTGEALGWNAETNAYWQLWVNGSYAQVGASQLYLNEGDRVEWRYAADGESGLPESPDQPGEDDEQDWTEIGSAASSNVTKAPTPTGKVEEAWSIELMDPSNFLPVSEPVVAGGKIFIAVGNRLMSLSADDRSVEASVSLSSSIDYTCRPSVSQGVLYVPLSSGVVEAYLLPTLTRLWTSESTARADQSSCSLTIMEKDGMSIVVYGTAAFGSAGYSSGSCVALDAQTGERVWIASLDDAGYYWTGAVQLNGFVVVGDTAGRLHAFDITTGEEQDCLALGSSISADAVVYNNTILIVTRGGVLHKIRVDANGELVSVAQQQVLGSCMAAPTVVGSTAVLCGTAVGSSNATALVLVNLETFKVEQTITQADGIALPQGGSAASALVSTQPQGTYIYFTVNWAEEPDATWSHYARGGNVYVYRIGDSEAKLLYAPGFNNANYCDSQIVCDEEGNLYYLNDSGILVKLVGASSKPGIETHEKNDTKAEQPKITSSIRNQNPNKLLTQTNTAQADTEQTSLAEASEAAIPQVRLTSSTHNVVHKASLPIPLWALIGLVGSGTGLIIALFLPRRKHEHENEEMDHA